jgi:hypothetical protein
MKLIGNRNSCGRNFGQVLVQITASRPTSSEPATNTTVKITVFEDKETGSQTNQVVSSLPRYSRAAGLSIQLETQDQK